MCLIFSLLDCAGAVLSHFIRTISTTPIVQVVPITQLRIPPSN